MGSSLEGVARLTRQLEILGKLENGKVLRETVREGIRPAHQMAQALIPVGKRSHITYRGRRVRPGFAKKSIRVEVTLSRNKQSASALLGTRKEAFYAPQFLELGTSRHGARPWLRPAFEGTIDKQQTAMVYRLSQAVNKAISTK